MMAIDPNGPDIQFDDAGGMWHRYGHVPNARARYWVVAGGVVVHLFFVKDDDADLYARRILLAVNRAPGVRNVGDVTDPSMRSKVATEMAHITGFVPDADLAVGVRAALIAELGEENVEEAN